MTKYFYSAVRKKATKIGGYSLGEDDPMDDLHIILQGAFRDDIASVYDYLKDQETVASVTEHKDVNILDVATTDGGAYKVSADGSIECTNMTEQALDGMFDLLKGNVVVAECASIKDAFNIIDGYGDRATFSATALGNMVYHFKKLDVSEAGIAIADFRDALGSKTEKDQFAKLMGDYPPQKPAM